MSVKGQVRVVADQKIDNLLTMSVDVDAEVREKSTELSAGYDAAEKTWQVIFRYNGDVADIEKTHGEVTCLYGGYAITYVTVDQLDTLANDPHVEYIEKPGPLSYAMYEAEAISCIPPVRGEPLGLTGKGVIVAIIDSGIDLYHPDFRKEDGSTRVLALWDQTLTPDPEAGRQPPTGYHRGVYLTSKDIDDMLTRGDRLPSTDTSGHGTHVAGIAAGNGQASRGEYRGVAYEADLLIVKLGSDHSGSYPQTAELMEAVDFCIGWGMSAMRPVALNLSYGNNYGPHTGTSLVETYLDQVSMMGRSVICIGSGNEGNGRCHASGRLTEGEVRRVDVSVSYGERSLSMQIWKQYMDSFGIQLYTPSGEVISLSENAKGIYQYTLEDMDIFLYVGEPTPYSIWQEIDLEILPAGDHASIRGGIWKIIISPQVVRDGKYDMWLKNGSSLGVETGYLMPDVDRTFTIPSTAYRPITVAAYDGDTDTYAPFSGRGYVCCHTVKPDIAAPGVDIVSCAPGGGYTAKSGTSMACPFVTGAAALLMQYGIVDQRDPYLYGEKVKAYLMKGARELPSIDAYPNDQVGWGALCVKDSLPT